MKKYFSIFIITLSLLIAGCSSGGKTENTATSPAETAATPEKVPLNIGTETMLLLKDLKENGDYVNSVNFPSLIKASIVNDNIGKNMLVVDLRSADQFRKGHIKGAVNKNISDLPGYFESGIKPFEFERIIMVCSDGALASYTTSLLRMMGYGNVYAMRWGMSAWNEQCAKESWLANLSGKYESQLEKTVHEKEAGTAMPDLKTGLTTGPEIAQERFRKLFREETDNVLVTAEKVFANPSEYYIINLERKDKYEDGHIPGAYRYKPESTLGFPEEMASIASDKPVVVYCGTGHNSGFATAYLRLFGYDAKTLRYGNNSFMYDKMVSQKNLLSWLPFTREDVNNFELVK
jgi:rhodanese-related sulfurtransferase